VRSARVGALRGATIACLRPEAVAARWGELLGLAPRADARGPRLELEGSWLRFVPAASPAGEGLVAFTVAAREPAAVLAAARARGRATGATGVTVCGTGIELEQSDVSR
jgi:hypothetical protein